MKRIAFCFLALAVMAFASVAQADTFGTGANQFTLDFVPISGDASAANGANISQYSFGDPRYRIFTDPDSNYRMGMHEITTGHWSKFRESLGVSVTGDPLEAYDGFKVYLGIDVPSHGVSWYEAAQFVNWLNTSTGHHAAYSFTGTQGTSDYALATWSAAEAAGGTNLYRHKDTFYFLPTEDEWVKAAYWNGTTLQEYATKDNSIPSEWTPTGGPNSDGQAAGWNYGWAYPDNGPVNLQPWDVTAGYSPEELNGTYDMMGNILEWMESPYSDPNYATGSSRVGRGGSWARFPSFDLAASDRYEHNPTDESFLNTGFRVASVPEPGSISLLVMGAFGFLAHGWRRRKH